MRKQARLGLVIGGTVLAALVVYLAFPARTSTPADRGAHSQAGATPLATNNDPFALTSLRTETPVPLPAADRLRPSPEVDPAGDITRELGLRPTDTDRARGDELALAGERREPAPTHQAVPPATRPADQIHKVAQGDTLERIAERYWGSKHLHPYLLNANPGVNPRNLRIGTNIVVPDIATLRSAQPNAVAVVHTPEPEAWNPVTHYKVQRGDSLYTISIKLYGNSKKLEEIYQLNRQTIGEDKARLKLGMLLQLPSAPTHLKP